MNINSKKSISQEKQAKKEKEIKGKMNKQIQTNILIAIGLMIYFLLLSTLYQTIGQIKVLEIIEILSIVFLFVAIFVIERAYKKDDGRLAIHSIEAMVIAAHTLSIKYVVTKYDFSFSLYITVSSYIFAIYYVFKSILVYTKERRKILESFSDIPEITKKEEPKVKEAKKRNNKLKVDESKNINQNINLENSKQARNKKIGNEPNIKNDKIIKDKNVNIIVEKNTNTKGKIEKDRTVKRTSNHVNKNKSIANTKIKTKSEKKNEDIKPIKITKTNKTNKVKTTSSEKAIEEKSNIGKSNVKRKKSTEKEDNADRKKITSNPEKQVVKTKKRTNSKSEN